MSDHEEHDGTTVGYGRPPKESQFKKGSSGNPKGRPKGSINQSTLLKRDGRRLVSLNGPQGTRKVTKHEAVVIQLGNQAVKGNLSATRLYLSMHQRIDDIEQGVQETTTTNERDEAGMASFLKRFNKQSEESDNEEDDSTKEDPQ